MGSEVCFTTRACGGQEEHVGHTLLDRRDCHGARFGADDLAALQLSCKTRERRVVNASRIDGKYQGHCGNEKVISYKITT